MAVFAKSRKQLFSYLQYQVTTTTIIITTTTNPTALPRTMPFSSPSYYFSHPAAPDVSSVASLVAATVVFLLLFLLWNERLREFYPTYDKIPATILSHMPSKKESAELDNAVDVIVSFIHTSL